VPVLAVLAAGMIAFVRRQHTLTVDSIFATVAAYLLLAMLFTQLYLCVITWNPATHTARMLAMFQAVVGVFYVAAVVALFVGTYTSQRRS